MRALLYMFFFTMLLVCCGCRSKDAAAGERQVEKPQKTASEQHRSPTDIFPFKAKQTPPPSLYDSTLSPRERELMRTFRSDGEIKITEPGQGQDAKASRKWVFGY